MYLHEYQAKELLKARGIAIPRGKLLENPSQLSGILKELGHERAVLKAQVHAGGRGKAGGIRRFEGVEKGEREAQELLSKRLVTEQTGPEGVPCQKLLVEELIPFQKEYYLAITIDRKNAFPMLLLSPEGGMSIEELAEERPEALLRVPLRYQGRLLPFQKRQIATHMGFQGKLKLQAEELIDRLITLFQEIDGSLCEINPLVQLADETLLALDAKIAIDENGAFRQKALAALIDHGQLPPLEEQARRLDLAYVSLGGSVGCIVNGAGLAMATMDLIHHVGSEPANFLDIGGGASRDKVRDGFALVLSDPKVKVLLVNIFGGIMNCAVLAEGMIEAVEKMKSSVPIVVRMEGTDVQRAKELLEKAPFSFHVALDLEEAGRLVVTSVKEG